MVRADAVPLPPPQSCFSFRLSAYEQRIEYSLTVGIINWWNFGVMEPDFSPIYNSRIYCIFKRVFQCLATYLNILQNVKWKKVKWLVFSSLPCCYFIADYWLLIIFSVWSRTLLLCKFHESHSNRRYIHFYSTRISFLYADSWVHAENTIPNAASFSVHETSLRPCVCVSGVPLLFYMSATM